MLDQATSTSACSSAPATPRSLPAVQETGGYVIGLNQAGSIVGVYNDPATFSQRGFRQDEDLMLSIPTLGGSDSFVTALNSAGEVVGYSALPGDAVSHAFLSSGGNLIDLGTLGGTRSRATDLNDVGSVVGYSGLANGSTHAFYYAAGTMHDLGTLGGSRSYAWAINAHGVVVGDAETANGEFHAFLFSGTQMIDLGTLGGNSSSAAAVNASGLVVGKSVLPSGATHAFLYADGQLQDLGALGGDYSSAWALNAAGQIIGCYAENASAPQRGFIFENGLMKDLGTLGGDTTYPTAINNQGQVVGWALTSKGTTHAFLWENGTIVDLNSLLPADSEWDLEGAEFINDAGRIVGYGSRNGAYEWFILDLVSGNQPPIANAGPDQTVNCSGTIQLDGSQSTDPDGDSLAFSWSAGGSVLGSGPVLTLSLPSGDHAVTLIVTDPCGDTAQAIVRVQVQDATAPACTLPALITAAAGADCQAPVPDLIPQLQAQDDCTPFDRLTFVQSPPPGTLVPLGTIPVTLTVIDTAGNQASAVTLFSVADRTPPTFAAIPDTLVLPAGFLGYARIPNLLDEAQAADSCTPADRLVLAQSPAPGKGVGLGTHTVTIRATDTSANTAEASVLVKVADLSAPLILVAPCVVVVPTGKDGQAAVPNFLPQVVALDNCTPPLRLAKEQSVPAGTRLATGQYTIRVTVADAAGNQTSRDILLFVRARPSV
jgi:probable HAF family extracellular repeat protein